VGPGRHPLRGSTGGGRCQYTGIRSEWHRGGVPRGAGPEAQRFDALKVGDKVTFRYYESIVYAITKVGDRVRITDTQALMISAGFGK
jgi:hypothetical protein